MTALLEALGDNNSYLNNGRRTGLASYKPMDSYTRRTKYQTIKFLGSGSTGTLTSSTPRSPTYSSD